MFPNAANDLGFGLGSSLAQQAQDETEEERKRRQMGLTPNKNSLAAQQLFGFGQTGVASAAMDLGLNGRRRF